MEGLEQVDPKSNEAKEFMSILSECKKRLANRRALKVRTCNPNIVCPRPNAVKAVRSPVQSPDAAFDFRDGYGLLDHLNSDGDKEARTHYSRGSLALGYGRALDCAGSLPRCVIRQPI
jgi:hypothetical protein